jgi:hypothetical protein
MDFNNFFCEVKKMSIYTERGFKNRKEYLEAVSREYDLPEEMVFATADLLGESEDFDGLLSMCADEAGTPVMEVWG